MVSGAAPGADSLAAKAARVCGLEVREYPAKWQKYGKAAGPIRNDEMLKRENPQFLLAFTKDIESSQGTRDIVQKACRLGIPAKVIC